MERKTVEIVKEDDGWVIASTPALDRDSDRVLPMGLDVSSFQKNPVIMWGHDYSSPFAVIGRAADMMLTPDAFRIRPEFREPASDSDPMHIIKALWDSEMVRAFSIGFTPQEWVENDEGGRDFTKAEILEISLVPIGANRDALRLAVKALGTEPGIDATIATVEVITSIAKALDEQQEFEQELDALLTDEQPASEPSDVDIQTIDASTGDEPNTDEIDEGDTDTHTEPSPMFNPDVHNVLVDWLSAIEQLLE